MQIKVDLGMEIKAIESNCKPDIAGPVECLR